MKENEVDVLGVWHFDQNGIIISKEIILIMVDFFLPIDRMSDSELHENT